MRHIQRNDPLLNSEEKYSELPPLLQNITVCEIRKSICIRQREERSIQRVNRDPAMRKTAGGACWTQ